MILQFLNRRVEVGGEIHTGLSANGTDQGANPGGVAGALTSLKIPGDKIKMISPLSYIFLLH